MRRGPGAAKNLFIDLMYFGGTQAWGRDYGIDPSMLPVWVDELKEELHRNAELLLGLPELKEFRSVYGMRSSAMEGRWVVSSTTASWSNGFPMKDPTCRRRRSGGGLALC